MVGNWQLLSEIFRHRIKVIELHTHLTGSRLTSSSKSVGETDYMIRIVATSQHYMK